jgi:nucleoside-diphosphate-sugar epimerase
MEKKIFITGGTGFLGAYLIRLLLQQGENRLYALRRGEGSKEPFGEGYEKVQWIEGDVRDPALMLDILSDMDQVYHAAAVTSYAPNMARKMWQVNVDGTTNIVNAALHHQIDKLVYVSSIAAIGRTSPVEEFDEQKIWQHSRWNTRYGFTKFHGELEVWRGIEEGLRASIINPSVMLGAGPWDRGAGKLFRWVYKGLRRFPEGATGWVDVRDVAAAALHLMESDILGKRYIISSENRSFQYILERIAESLDRPAPVKRISPFQKATVWRWAAFRSLFSKQTPLITRETVRQSSCIFHYHNQLSVKELGISYTPIRKTIEETAGAFLKTEKQGVVEFLPF